MFNISFWEILLVAIVALVVLGPERLPSAMQRVGRLVRDARAVLAKTRQEIEHALQEESEKS